MHTRYVSRDNIVPLYHQVLEILEKEIAEGKYPVDTLFPSETQLIHKFGVSRVTIRRALSELELHGQIVRIQGQGTFIKNQPIELELTALTGFVEDMLEKRYRPSARVVTIQQVFSNKKVSEMLKIEPGTMVTYIERIRLSNGAPLSFDTTWLPNPIGEEVAKENLEVFPIFSLLEEKMDIQLDHALYNLQSKPTDQVTAKYLEQTPGDSIMVVERTVFTKKGNPVDYEILHYRGDKIKFSLTLGRKHPAWKLGDLKSQA